MSKGEHRIIARSYLDTLDWRLLKSGYLLIAEPRDDFVGLQLRSLTGNDLISQARADSLPRDLSSFPLGKIRDLIAPVMDVRALVEQVRSRVEQQVFHKIDDDGKMLVSAFLERSVTKHPVVSREPLCRLTINALKGYESDADKVVKRITRNGDFIASDETDLEKLIHSASIDINRFKSKPEINLARGDRSDSAIKKMLLDLLDLIEINRQPILEDVDVECLHDYRVSVRTTRVILKQLPDVFPKATVDRFSAGFKKLGDLTSELRDLDVMLLEFDQYSSMAPKGHRNHLESVREFLATRRLDLFNGLSRYLNSASYRNFVGRWRSFLLKPCPVNTRIRNARRPIEELL
ncbi:MAG: CHAD domain-containing protein, partial [bacterium]